MPTFITRHGPVTPLTIALVLTSILITFVTGFGSSELTVKLLISKPGSVFLAEVRAGEVWRLVTPIFLHLSLLHIVFNMMWLWDLGRVIEYKRGWLYFVVFVLVVGVGSNLAEYSISGPGFGGMSGVVYGLLGYVWMQGKYNPHAGYVLHKPIVIMMLIWFAVCWTGLLGPIANWAHTGGLVLGTVWGFLDRRR